MSRSTLPPPSSGFLRILVVDDDEAQRRSLTLALRCAGFEVAHASSGADALQHLARGLKADVALVDLMMPDLSGLDLARQMKTSYPEVRVILSSAYHLSARQLERSDCGAIGFVPKPYDIDELARYLRKSGERAVA